LLLVKVNVAACAVLPDVAVMVTVEVVVVVLLPDDPPQAPRPSSSSASTTSAGKLNSARYLRNRASIRHPMPMARLTSGAGRPPVWVCTFAAAEAANVTVDVIADPAGVSVAGLKLHPTEAGRPVQAKLTVPVNPFSGVTVSVAVAGTELVSVPLPGLMPKVKSGAGAVMVTGTALDVDAANDALPP
jgi:hypothetical protein